MATKCKNGAKPDSSKTKRRLFVMRHGERCDFTFGKAWVTRSFDDKGNYTQTDLNLPVNLIPRDCPKDFLKDSPLTEIGTFQAMSTGKAFNRAGLDIKHVYVSPSLRCIQTAQNVIDGMGNNAQMRVEPAAFEWFGWYKNAMPNWISTRNLADWGFSVVTDHKPFFTIKDLSLDESVTEYYERCHRLVQRILKKHEDEGGDVLVVAHAGSLDTFTRQLTGKAPRNSQEMHHSLSHFTYCCLCCSGENVDNGKWSLQQPPIMPLHEFDWKNLL